MVCYMDMELVCGRSLTQPPLRACITAHSEARALADDIKKLANGWLHKVSKEHGSFERGSHELACGWPAGYAEHRKLAQGTAVLATPLQTHNPKTETQLSALKRNQQQGWPHPIPHTLAPCSSSALLTLDRAELSPGVRKE